ncbi:MAG: two pore domain potassium channel family protein [Pseudomonadales bacterium]|nr:two pore domain potassium channel family protein [Pseudomonadales bacterium]NIX07679.1 two pore domain potassium channel family protein [Pseudomonadales bacterium]
MNLLYGLAVMIVCLLLQACLLIVALRFYGRHQTRLTGSSFPMALLLVGGVMLLLVAGNLAQVGIWGLLFILLGEFQQVGEAMYHSAVNFATLGYGDIVMSDAHKMLGPLQAINGILMIGVSTAVLMAAVQDVIRKTAGGERG